MDPTKENIKTLNNHNQSLIDEIDGSAKNSNNGLDFYDQMMKRQMDFQQDILGLQAKQALQDLEIQKRYDAYLDSRRKNSGGF